MGAIEAEVIETWDKRDGRGRKLRLVERRAGFVRTYQSSGLTMAAFARREGLKYSTFAGWVLRSAARSNGRAAMAAEGERQLAAGNAFLAQNKTRPGVKATASGLQYVVLVQGLGPKPKATDRVKVHYHGTLIDGTVFDSSVQRGQPIEFAVNGVIQGWTEALQLMPVGSKWKLTIPPGLGYGARANGKIPPNSVLLFEVELLGIK